MVNVCGSPTQDAEPYSKYGVTEIVAITGNEPLFRAIKEGILPVPLAASPMPGVLLVQI